MEKLRKKQRTSTKLEIRLLNFMRLNYETLANQYRDLNDWVCICM